MLILSIISLFILLSYCYADTTVGLVGWWKFDERRGEVVDSSKQGNNGISTGANILSRKDCVRGGCRSFNGPTDYIDIPDVPSLRISQGTISCWIKRIFNSARFEHYVSKDNSGGDWGYFLQVNSAGKIEGGFNKSIDSTGAGEKSYAEGNTNLSVGVWYLIAVTFNGSYIKVYLNGVEDGSKSETARIPAYTGDFRIGRLRWKDSFHSGVNANIDEVRIYNRSLTASEIKSLYQSNR